MDFIIVVAFFIISVSAVPKFDEKEINFRDERFVSNYVTDTIADTSRYMKDAGFDPMYLDKIFNNALKVEEFSSNGMSNIVVNSVSYSILSSRLNFDIELPLIDFSVGAASAENTIFGDTFRMNSSGKIEIQRMRFIGHIRINVNFGTGITIRSTSVKFSMDGIGSDVQLFVQENDYSSNLNEFLKSTVPANFKTYSSEINELLGILITDYGNQYLKEQRN